MGRTRTEVLPDGRRRTIQNKGDTIVITIVQEIPTDETLYAQLAARVKASRETKGLSLREMARRLGMAHGNYAKFERTGPRSVASLARVAQVLEVDPGELLAGLRFALLPD